MSGVSIVIPTYERIAFLREAVRSALDQGDDVDVIVVRSNGDTAANDVGEEFPGVAVLESPGERAEARNAGCRVARRDWILFLDDDDRLLPGAVASLVSLGRTERADAVRGERVDHADGEPVPTARSAEAATRWLARRDLITGAEILTPSQTLFRRAALPRDPFREDLVPAEDFALGATLAVRGSRVMASGTTTTAYRRHPGQSSASERSRESLQRRRAVLDDLGPDLSGERRVRRQARGYHELYARVGAELAAGRRRGALAAVASSAVWSPRLLRDSMWWRAAAHVARRRGGRS